MKPKTEYPEPKARLSMVAEEREFRMERKIVEDNIGSSEGSAKKHEY